MRTVLPGRPRARLQAVCTGYWENKRIIAYITGNAFVILGSHNSLLQTIYDGDDTPLDAIAIDEASGKIAASSGSSVRIYKPYGQDEGALKWSLQASISLDGPGDSISTLSWGTSEELLVGSSSLTLYNTQDGPNVIWKKMLANTSKIAVISHDSGYIASTGPYDRLAKVWRRLSYGSDDIRFDLTYLPHPQTVTSLRWRRPYYLDQTIENVLYTICSDSILRIWAATDLHSMQILHLWAQVDLKESIQPRSPTSREFSILRYAFIIDGRDFSKATEHAVQEAGLEQLDQDDALEHLIEVANRSPEVCMVLDERGYMSAWGLENVGGKDRKTTSIFNISHVDGLKFNISSQPDHGEDFCQIYSFCNQEQGNLNLLVHHFDGRIECFESNVAHLFDPSRREDRITSKGIWTGHSGPIKKIVRNISGSAIVSRTNDNESVVWRHVESKDGMLLQRKSIIGSSNHIHRICVLRGGNFVVFLHYESIDLWDCRSSKSKLMASHKYFTTGKPLCILVLPEMERQGSIAHIATITSKMKGIVWQLQLPHDSMSTYQPYGTTNNCIKDFSTFDLGDAEDLAYVLPVDPAGSPPVISGFLDTFARDVAISYTNSGFIRSWTAKVDMGSRKVDWLLTCSVETGIVNPALVSGSSIRKAALVNSGRSELTIWDVRGTQLEYAQDFNSQDSIRDLDWTSTPDDQSILAVGFQYRVLLLSQMRYDYLDKGPAWAAIRAINIRDLTPHPIGDSTWLGGGNLLIGAGNQLFVYDKQITASASLNAHLRLPKHKDTDWDLFEVVTRLNGPLPLFHPQILGQCILSGKITLVQRILLVLYKTLKYHVEGDSIDNLLGMDLEDFYTGTEIVASAVAKKELNSAFAEFLDEDDIDSVTEIVASALNEKLTTITIPQLSGQEQIHLAGIVECVALVEKHRRSMDDNAARFMLFFRQHALRRGRSNEVSLSWREINWAFHSNSQDILTDMVNHQFHGRIVWENARESGMFMWITDYTALRNQFEAVARNEYTKSDMKNPADCSLFYLALKKKTVLQGLWRMAGWNREQGATIKLLANNFQDPKWRTVAMKNAYALLGKHRFEYAAAFFLLADCLKDAVNVCLNQLKDIQLAIAVTRIYEGDNGPMLKELLEEKVLPLAAEESNRWLASWAFWMLHRKDMAVRALISPVYTLLETPQSPVMQAKLYLTDDPALVVLYSQLRQKTLQTLRGASRVTPKVEWAFVLHSARLYDRMGCDLLALDLVRNWEFLLAAPMSRGSENEADPRKMLRRRSSLVVADLPMHSMMEAHSGGKKPPACVFEEPESSLLLDSFGF